MKGLMIFVIVFLGFRIVVLKLKFFDCSKEVLRKFILLIYFDKKKWLKMISGCFFKENLGMFFIGSVNN